MHFSIVTPVLNGARFIDETILNVVSQAGDFSIRYHVQDGGSTDGTLNKLARWRERLVGDFPVLCRHIKFTYATAPDQGIYDAVNRGFAACGSGEVMSWINADDRYEPGGFQAVTTILHKFTAVDWLCGRVANIDEGGTLLVLCPVHPFPRDAILAGMFDGSENLTFIQQEGVFWRSWLWERVGGVNTAFRLAGDLDLWRRFAEHADLVSVDAILGCWRRRTGQLSENLTAYCNEARRANDRRDSVALQLRRGHLPHRIIDRPRSGDWRLQQLPEQRGTLAALWALRRFLPRSLSIRARIS